MEARVAAAVLVLLALVLVVPEACRAERFIVGDAARWTWGYNYTDWVIRKGPFFQDDSLGTQLYYSTRVPLIFRFSLGSL
uniref:Phytocyanin domain-containing protein n=1 Tax=Aegilops tauschii subsp. strangulata TaxID=200361 RepID=A0A453R496_AEGTS